MKFRDIREKTLNPIRGTPPAMLVLQRRGIREFPNGQKIALYTNQKYGLTFSVPYGGSSAVQQPIVATPISEAFSDSGLGSGLMGIAGSLFSAGMKTLASNKKKAEAARQAAQEAEEQRKAKEEAERQEAARIKQDKQDLYRQSLRRLKTSDQPLEFNEEWIVIGLTESGQYVVMQDMINNILSEKLNMLKLRMNTQLDEGSNVKIVKARVRGGKIQRRKKVSARPGYTIRGGKLVRMSAAEKRNRKKAAKKGVIKRRAQKAKIRLAQARSRRKRQSLGL